MTDYIKNPEEIYSASFAKIDAEADLSLIPPAAHGIARRMIHACGMTEITRNLIVSPDFVPACEVALLSGGRILVDAEMVRHGIITRLFPDRDRIVCTLNDPQVKDVAKEIGNTRSAAAVELWRPFMAGSIAVIGNAPTALYHLLDIIEAGGPRPAAIVALPVGFVGAVESKEHIIANSRGVPFITLRGRQGGSAMAAAVINALLGGNE